MEVSYISSQFWNESRLEVTKFQTLSGMEKFCPCTDKPEITGSALTRPQIEVTRLYNSAED